MCMHLTKVHRHHLLRENAYEIIGNPMHSKCWNMWPFSLAQLSCNLIGWPPRARVVPMPWSEVIVDTVHIRYLHIVIMLDSQFFGDMVGPNTSNCTFSADDLCLLRLAFGPNGSFSNDNMDTLLESVTQVLKQPCRPDPNYSWKIEHDFIVSVTLTILAIIGLAGNAFSCVVIFVYLLRTSGTFVLFIFLSLADSLVVVMQTIDAYRSSTAMHLFTSVPSNHIDDPFARGLRDARCKLFGFFWHFSLQLSAWLIMLLSVDRYMTLRQGYAMRQRRSVLRRAWILGGSILVAVMCFNLPHLIFTRSAIQRTSCGVGYHLIIILCKETR